MKAGHRRTLVAGLGALLLLLVACLLLLASCFVVLPSQGGGQATFDPPRQVDPADVALPAGYSIEVVATGLSLPSGVAFDDEGRAYVLEAGYSYGEIVTTPKLLRVEEDGSTTVVASGDNPPWNGVTFHDGSFYVAGGTLEGGRLLEVQPDGEVVTLAAGLPSFGDHHTNGPVAADGWLYFGQGTATNSGVVGVDNAQFGWLHRYPAFHDIPCEDIVLTGRNFRTPNPLTEDASDRVTTGAFVPFGTETSAGQVIPGAIPCNGAVLRMRPDGSRLELVAWGFRNPFGLAFAPSGELYVTDNQYDVRGSRPVFGTGDLLWRVTPGQWYGWPDFHAGRPITDEDFFGPPGKPAPELLLADPPGDPPTPSAILGVHSSSNGMDFSRSSAFGYAGDVFIAQFGDMAPGVGKVLAPVGFKVVRANTDTGVVHDFAVNRARASGPASLLGTNGLERPVDVQFDPSGDALYVVDFGVMTIGENPEPRLGTGVLWKIERESRP